MRRGHFVLLLIAASACHNANTLTPPDDVTITVSSPNTNVLFGSTEQMTATASDGRALTEGTWVSDTPSVATITTTGLVTPVGAGFSNISFALNGRQATKRLRALPDLNGTFAGKYDVTSCTETGQVADANLCAVFPLGSAGMFSTYAFNFTQSGDLVTGRFFIGTVLFENVSGTIDPAGNLSVGTRATTTPPTVVDASWSLVASRPNTFGGTVSQVWTHTGLTGQANIHGSISSFSR